MKRFSLSCAFAVLVTTLLGIGTAYADEHAAGFYIEPAVTYELGNWTATFPAPFNDTSGTSNGFGLDLKVGFHFADVVFLAADGMMSKPDFKNPANNYDATATSTLYGVDVGAQMPLVGLRIWGGYIFGGTLDPDASNNVNVKFSNATGYKIGAGFQIIHVSLNLEYLGVTYGTTELEQLGPFATNANLGSTQLKNNEYVLSVSFPVAL